MPNTGKDLEALVALIEKLHLPPGLEVTTNEHIYDEHGIQIAEFDIQVKGKVGTTDIAWPIECRDRPSEGPAPGSWIEQLIGRRGRFMFNKVTAVSTTGFAAGALRLAREKGIELREVRSLTAADVSGWLRAERMAIVQPSCRLFNAILCSGNESEARQRAFDKTVTTHPNEPILWHVKNQKYYTIRDAFRAALSEAEGLLQQVERDKPARQLTMRVRYPTDNHHFVVKTKSGPVRVREIEFHGELEVKTTAVPLSRLREYVHSGSDEIISQSGAFVFDALDSKLSLEMHKLAESGEIRLSIRNLGAENEG
jgi:hypothetical protein